MSYAKEFALLGALLGLLAPGGLLAYALVRGGAPDPVTIFLIMAAGGSLCLGAAGWMIGRREDLLADRNAELRALSEQLQQQSLTDALTGLANRRAFDSELQKEIVRSERYRTGVSLVMLDIDHFKRLNDSHGHPAGDEVLRFLGRVLESQKRRGDVVARYGGEEFAVILPHTGAEDAARWAERVRQVLSLSTAETKVGPLTITASFGVATFGVAQNTREKLIAAADKALYVAKNGGRNRVHPQPRVAEAQIPPS